MSWWVYMILADDGSLYTGVTTDVPRRFREHESGRRGARYFAGRNPLEVVYTERQDDRSKAQMRESAIKKLRRQEKRKLFQRWIEFR